MLKYLFKGILAGLAIKLLDNYRSLSLQLLKIEAAKCYLHGVRMARLSAIGLMRMGLLIALMGIGALLFHAGLFVLLPCTVQTKAVLGICLGVAYIVIGTVALRALMAEKTWMKKSGATEMLGEATRRFRND